MLLVKYVFCVFCVFCVFFCNIESRAVTCVENDLEPQLNASVTVYTAKDSTRKKITKTYRVHYEWKVLIEIVGNSLFFKQCKDIWHEYCRKSSFRKSFDNILGNFTYPRICLKTKKKDTTILRRFFVFSFSLLLLLLQKIDHKFSLKCTEIFLVFTKKIILLC